MPKPNVLSFIPYMAVFDVRVEVTMITAIVTLCFGPFNSRDAAIEWATEVERLHRKGVARQGLTSNIIASDEFPAPQGDYLTSSVEVRDVIMADSDARKPGRLIPIGTPEYSARHMHICALLALKGASTETLLQLAEEVATIG